MSPLSRLPLRHRRRLLRPVLLRRLPQMTVRMASVMTRVMALRLVYGRGPRWQRSEECTCMHGQTQLQPHHRESAFVCMVIHNYSHNTGRVHLCAWSDTVIITTQGVRL